MADFGEAFSDEENLGLGNNNTDEVPNAEENKTENETLAGGDEGDGETHVNVQKQQKTNINIELAENENKDIENSSLEAPVTIKKEEIPNSNPIKKELEEIVKQEDDKSDGEIQPDSKEQENENQEDEQQMDGVSSVPSGNANEISNGQKPGSAVYIANLQWWTTDADVERFCSAYGQVVSIQFLAERSNGKSKGVALVEFSDSQAAIRCKEGLTSCNIHGRTCVVTFPAHASNRTNMGNRGFSSFTAFERGRHTDGRGGRGRTRPYNQDMYDARQLGAGAAAGGAGLMMGPPDIPAYMHDMGMMDMGLDMVGIPHMDSAMMGHGPPGPAYMPPPPYSMQSYMPNMERDAYMRDSYYRPRSDRWHGDPERDRMYRDDTGPPP